MCGFIAQLVEHRTGIAEVMGSNPVEALIFFFRLLLSNCLNWKIYCDDHTSLTVQEADMCLFLKCNLFILFIIEKFEIGGKSGTQIRRKYRKMWAGNSL